MILTVTANASVDKAYRIETPLVDGSVHRVSLCSDSAGGKGLNTARAVITCGEDSLATGFVGGNNGRYLCELANKDGIPEDFVHVSQETRCCINVLEPNGRSTEFLEPGRPVTSANVESLRKKIQALMPQTTVVTINGSAPRGMTPDDYAGLIELIRSYHKPCILDTSGELLARGIQAHPTVIKPNADEISQLLGRPVVSDSEIIEAAVELHKSGIAYVLVSLGGKGAFMVCAKGVFRGYAPKINVLNPVGAGDTLVGAFAVGFVRGYDAREQLRYALSCASASCLAESTGRFDPKIASELLEQTEVKRITL